MSENIHSRFADTAERMLAKHGRPMLLLIPHSTGPEFNRQITWTERPITGVVVDYSLSERDGRDVQIEDKQILVAFSDGPISNEMRVVSEPDTPERTEYEIIRANELRPGSTGVLYTLQVRL